MKKQTYYRLYIELEWGGAFFCEETYLHSTKEGTVAELLQEAPMLETALHEGYEEEKMDGYEGSFEQWKDEFFYGEGSKWYECTLEWCEAVCIED